MTAALRYLMERNAGPAYGSVRDQRHEDLPEAAAPLPEPLLPNGVDPRGDPGNQGESRMGTSGVAGRPGEFYGQRTTGLGRACGRSNVGPFSRIQWVYICQQHFATKDDATHAG